MFYDDQHVDSWVMYAYPMWYAHDLPDMETQFNAWREVGGTRNRLPRKMLNAIANKQWMFSRPILVSPTNYWYYCSPSKLWTGYAVWSSQSATKMAREFAYSDYSIAGLSPIEALGSPFWHTYAYPPTQQEKETLDAHGSLLPCAILRKCTLESALLYANKTDSNAWQSTKRVTWYLVAQCSPSMVFAPNDAIYELNRGAISTEPWNTRLHTFIRTGVINDVPLYSCFANEDYIEQAMLSLQPKHVQSLYANLLSSHTYKIAGKKKLVIRANMHGVANGGRFCTEIKNLIVTITIDNNSVTDVVVSN